MCIYTMYCVYCLNCWLDVIYVDTFLFSLPAEAFCVLQDSGLSLGYEYIFRLCCFVVVLVKFHCFFSHQIHKKCSERSNFTDFTTSLLTLLIYVAYTFCVQGFATTLLRNQHTVQCDISCATRNARIQGLLDTDGSVASKHKILRTSWVDRNCRQCDGLTVVEFCTLTVLNNRKHQFEMIVLYYNSFFIRLPMLSGTVQYYHHYIDFI